MTITNGQVADADEVLQITKIEEIYSGAGFDCTLGVTGSYEMTAISATKLVNASYINISITGHASAGYGGTPGGATVQVKAQIKETGGAYGDVVAYKTMAYSGVGGESNQSSQTYNIIATVTAGMKTNGCQVKVFSTGSGGAGSTASFTNIQTFLEVKP